jgi:hypothetical protein
MGQDKGGIPDGRPPAPLERGEVLSNIKRWALIGYAQEVGGDAADFERRWREAFYADVPVPETEAEGCRG